MGLSLSLSLSLSPRSGVLPATPTMASSVTYEGITYSFYDAASGGALKTVAIYTGAEGQPNVVADAATYMQTDVPSVQLPTTAADAERLNANGSVTPVALSATPLWANGMQKNPQFFNGIYDGIGLPQGFDESRAYYAPSGAASLLSRLPFDATKNVDPGYTGTRVQLVEGSYVKTKRSASFGTALAVWRTYDYVSVLHVLPAVPAVGFFSPPVAATSKAPIYFASQRDKTALGSGFTLPGTAPDNKISLAAAEAAGYFTRGLQPFFGQNAEQRRRDVIIDSDLSGNGYARDFGLVWNDWLTGLLALGSSAPDASLNRALSFAMNIIGHYDAAGYAQRGGAGQHAGYKQFVQLLGHVFNGVSGLHAKCLAIEGSVTHQPYIPISGAVGLAADFPNSNHQVFYRPFSSVNVGQYHWQIGGQSTIPAIATTEFSSEFYADYESTAGIANYGEILNIGLMKNWPGGLDGSQVLEANHPAAIGYNDFYRTISESYGVTISNAKDDAMFDQLRSSWAVPLKASVPYPASPISGVTAGASSFSWDYSTMGHAQPAATAAETQYSMDGIIWSSAVTGLTGTASSLVPGWRYYTRRRRQNTAGWGDWSYNVGATDQSVTAKSTGTTTLGSRTITMTIAAGSPSVRVGDLIAGLGITPGSYITAFGTGTGAAGNTGTYTMSMPAYEAQTSQQYRLAPMPAMATPTGTPSGTVTWATNPAIYRRTYSGYTGPLFTVAALDGSDAIAGDIMYCGMGIATGAVQAPTFQWKRDGADISGATGQGYQRVTADNGTTLTCTVTSNGQSATTAGIVVPGTVFPTAFNQVTFDGTNDWITRTTPAAFTGAADSQQLTIAMPIQMLAGDSAVKSILRWGDAAGTSSTDNIITVDRTAANGIIITLRTPTGGTAVFNASTTAGTLNVAAGKKLLMISLDLATAGYQVYLDNTAMTLGTVTGTLAACGLTSIQRPMTMNTLATTGPINAALDYLFVHPAKIDLSIQGNRDKFAATSAGIGNDGKGPFGVTPLVFMHGTAADWNAGTNWGSGGNVNMVGAVT